MTKQLGAIMRRQISSPTGVRGLGLPNTQMQNGGRVSKTIGGTTQYLYDGANPVQEMADTSVSANLLAAGVDEYFQRTDSAGPRSFLTDALGSTLALADSSGTLQTSYTYEPFGNTSVSGASTTNSFAFTGRELDFNGLYFYRARYYSPIQQQFVAEDPLREAGDNINFYSYVGDEPTDFTDVFGLRKYDCSLFGGCSKRTFGPKSMRGRKDEAKKGGFKRCVASASGAENSGIARGYGQAALGTPGILVGVGLVAELGPELFGEAGEAEGAGQIFAFQEAMKGTVIPGGALAYVSGAVYAQGLGTVTHAMNTYDKAVSDCQAQYGYPDVE